MSLRPSNFDDHLRNHGFLWAGRRGWALSPCYDLNPVPDAPRILSTRIDFDEASASLALLREVAQYFLPAQKGDEIIRNCAKITQNWRDYAHQRQASEAEMTRLAPAFEHEELEAALAL